MTQIDHYGNVIADNFLTARNILTIAKKDVRLVNNKESTLLTVQEYENHLAHWRYFRTTGVLINAFNYEYKHVRDFFAFCSRMHQPYMFITPDEMILTLNESGMLPYVISDGKTTKQIYRSVYREYFASIDSNADASEIEKMLYIRRCTGEMIISRHFFPLFFETLDEELESITLTVKSSDATIHIAIANQQNIIIYTHRYPLNDIHGFPRSHLDILADVAKTFGTEPAIDSIT